MKKLTIAACAALCATVGFSDVTSANVVGYQALPVIKGGNTMVAPTFANVGVNGKFKLSDLTVVGCKKSWWNDEDPTDMYWEDGCKGGHFYIQVLDQSGYPTATYYWLDYTKGDQYPAPASKIYGPGWFTSPDGGVNFTPATPEILATEFTQGQAFWIFSNAKTAAGVAKVSLQPAGSVEKSEVAFNIFKGGNTAVGVCTPRAVTLSELTVANCKKSWWNDEDPTDMYWEDGCKGGHFYIQVLDQSGYPTATYYWLDYTKGDQYPAPASKIYGPGWFTSPDGGVNFTPATPEILATEFPAGQGFWVFSNAKVASGKTSVQLVIPGVDL